MVNEIATLYEGCQPVEAIEVTHSRCERLFGDAVSSIHYGERSRSFAVGDEPVFTLFPKPADAWWLDVPERPDLDGRCITFALVSDSVADNGDMRRFVEVITSLPTLLHRTNLPMILSPTQVIEAMHIQHQIAVYSFGIEPERPPQVGALELCWQQLVSDELLSGFNSTWLAWEEPDIWPATSNRWHFMYEKQGFDVRITDVSRCIQCCSGMWDTIPNPEDYKNVARVDVTLSSTNEWAVDAMAKLFDWVGDRLDMSVWSSVYNELAPRHMQFPVDSEVNMKHGVEPKELPNE